MTSAKKQRALSAVDVVHDLSLLLDFMLQYAMRKSKREKIEKKWFPSREDWEFERSKHNPDTMWAFDHFFGKSLQEAETIFATNPPHWQEALVWMPSTPFRFYARAFMNSFINHRIFYSTSINSFFSLFLFYAIVDERDINYLSDDIKKVIEFFLNNKEEIDMDWDIDIFGDFETKVNQVLNRIEYLNKKWQ